ncbi:glycosyltransferase [uncultured Polaribacter sp.]|uniref:glycosyltransferase n=1 Tax=uncultured Polaribacter sp. TaxID=174711 RepID=UPI002604C3AE|nr:glycosyltransferase [uncultured Polaribacter sp.]
MTTTSKKIIIAPLNWGLGHATRCIPIINALISEKFTPIIASDGNALEFLKQEFPTLETILLPSYNITYGKNLKLSLLLQLPKIIKAVQQEHAVIKHFLAANKDVVGLISDNRFGVRNNTIPSVYITHQLNVLSGFTSMLTSKIHQIIIKKFDECWVPDQLNSEFSGKLSISNQPLNQKFIGVLSRFTKQELPEVIDVLVIISGPEPSRTNFEKKLISEFKNDTRNIVFVLGIVEKHQKKWKENNCTFYNYVLSAELESFINSSKVVVCRSGYTSIMDLAVLEKKVFFIPTKNQEEQEYLATYLYKNKTAPFSNLIDFTAEKLDQIAAYKGLSAQSHTLDSVLFGLFHGK